MVALQQNPVSLDHGEAFVYVWIARAGLLLCLALPTRPAIGQPRAALAPVGDSLRWRTQVVTDTLLRRLQPVIAIVRKRGVAVPYLMTFPTDTTLVAWSRVRRVVGDTLQAREATDADSLAQVLTVEMQRATPTGVTIRLFIGAKWRCQGEWLGGGSGEDIFVPWDSAPPPPLVRVSIHSHSLACRTP